MVIVADPKVGAEDREQKPDKFALLENFLRSSLEAHYGGQQRGVGEAA
jgi:hypothetical protein